MPKPVQLDYERWIRGFPESDNQRDYDMFYLFLHKLFTMPNLKRDSDWLRENIQVDAPKVSERKIVEYCKIYDTIREYRTVHKRPAAKSLEAEDFKKIFKR